MEYEIELAMRRKLESSSSDKLIQMLISDDEAIRYTAATILSEKVDGKLIRVVFEFSKSQNAIKREMAARLLGNMVSDSNLFYINAIDSLVNMLINDVEEKVRANAAAALFQLKTVLKIVSMQFNHLDVLKKLDTVAVDVLLRCAFDDSTLVRESIAYSLAGFSSSRAESALIVLSDDVDEHVRDWATLGLVNLNLDTPQIKNALLKRLIDKNEDIRIEAICGLAELKEPSVFEVIENELDKSDVALEIMEAAGNLQDKRLLPRLYKLHEKLGGSSPTELRESIKRLEKTGGSRDK